MSNGLREGILQALDALIDPVTGQGLVAAGRIQGLEVRGQGQVRFALEAPAGEAARYVPLRDAAEAAARGQKGVSDVQAVLTSETAAPSSPRGGAPAGIARLRKGEPAPERPPSKAATRAPEGLPGVSRIVAVSSAKGGVGKSTVAINLALGFAARGLSVGILDLDVFGPSLPTLLGLADAKPDLRADGNLEPLRAFGLKAMSIGFIVDIDAPMIWRGPMATSAVRQLLDDVAWAPLDLLVLDLPPGTGDVQLTLAQRLPLSGAVIVSTPQELALADVRRGLAMFERTHVPILGVIENMAWLDLPDGGRLHPFGEGGAQRTAQAAGAPFLGALPLDPRLRESADAGRPLVATDPGHATSLRFLALADAVLEQLDIAAKPAPIIRFED